MEATKATEPSQDAPSQNTRLDDRYGKIGISAVAAALHFRGERHNPHLMHGTPRGGA